MGKMKQYYHDEIEGRKNLNQGKTPKQSKDSLDFAIKGIIVILLICFALFVGMIIGMIN
jgi:hypothetical protein